MAINSNTRTLTADQIKTEAGSYTVSLPSSPPAPNTALVYNGVNYVWSTAGGGGGSATQVSINNNQSSFANTGVLVDIANDIGFTIDYSAERKFNSLSPLLKQSVMDNIGVANINKFFSGSILAFALQSDGKIVVGGTFGDYASTVGRSYLVRFNADGTLDTAFCVNASDGSKFNISIRSVALQADGKILVGGGFTAYAGTASRNYLVRLNSDGTLDTTFCINAVDGAKFNNQVESIAVQSDGKILVGGNFTNYAGTVGRNYLVRLNSDGTLDTTFCTNAVDGAKFGNILYPVTIQSDGKILVGGAFTNYAGTVGRDRLIRLNSDGTLDTTFCINASDGSKINSTILSMAVQSDGKIVVGGAFTNYAGTVGRSYLVRFNADGTLDTAFCINASDGAKFNNLILSIAVQSDGKILAGGYFTSYAGTAGRDRLVRLNTDGTVDTVFCTNAVDGVKFNSQVESIKIDAHGNILVGGAFTFIAGARILVIFNTDGTVNFSLTDNTSGLIFKFNSSVNSVAPQADGKIVVGGTFTSYGGTIGRDRLVRLNSDCTLDTTFCTNAVDGAKFNNQIKTITIQSDGKILVSGAFTNYAGTVGRDRLIRLNSDGTLDTAFCINASDGAKFNNPLEEMTLQSDGKILVGGNFTSYGGTTNRNRLVRLNSDGTVDAPFCINASDASKFGSNVFSITIQSDGKILVGGGFTNYATSSGRNRLVRLNSDGTVDAPFCINASDGSKINFSIFSIAVQSDGKILVGGSFSNYGGTSGRNNLVRLNTDGTLDTAFCTNAVDGSKFNGPTVSVNRTILQADGKILVGGSFTNYGGTSGRSYLVRFNADGTLDTLFANSAVDSKISGSINAISVDSSYNLYFGGGFAQYNNNRYIGFLVLNPQLFGGIVQSQIGVGKIQGYVNLNGTIVSSATYPEAGSTGVSLQVNSSTGNIQYTSNNIYQAQDYVLEYGYLKLLVQNL